MKTRISALALIALLSGPLPLAAQEATEAPAETPATGTVTADSPTGEGLVMGAEVGKEPGVGDTYTAARFETWEQRCVKSGLSADPCQLYQLLKDEKGNAVAEFAVFSLPEGAEGPAVAGATVIAPLETLLTTGLTIQVDTNKARAYPFTFCSEMGCVARLGFTAEEIDMFRKGGNAVLTIVPFVAPDQKVGLQLSLKGFTAGLKAVTEANKAADAAAQAAGAPAPAPAEIVDPNAAPAEAPAAPEN